MKSITNYSDYRKLLKDLIEYKKRNDAAFSINRLSARIGISPSLLKMILQGQRKLNTETLLKIADAFNFNLEEKIFFDSLVQENQAVTPEERHFHQKKRKLDQMSVRSSSCRLEHPIAMDEWYYPALLLYLIDVETVAENGLENTNYSVLQKLFSIDEEKLNQILQDFQKRDLLAIRADGKVHLCLDNVGITLKRQSFILSVIKEAHGRCQTKFRTKGNYFGVDTLSIAEEQIPNFVSDYQNLVSRCIEKDLPGGDTTKVIQLALQLFSVN